MNEPSGKVQVVVVNRIVRVIEPFFESEINFVCNGNCSSHVMYPIITGYIMALFFIRHCLVLFF